MPDDDEIYEPDPGDTDPAAEREMQQGQVDLRSENDLCDPWLRTGDGRTWLADRGEG